MILVFSLSPIQWNVHILLIDVAVIDQEHKKLFALSSPTLKWHPYGTPITHMAPMLTQPLLSAAVDSLSHQFPAVR